MLDSTVVCRRALGCEWGEVLRKKKKKKLQGLRKDSEPHRKIGTGSCRSARIICQGGWSRMPVHSIGTRLTLITRKCSEDTPQQRAGDLPCTLHRPRALRLGRRGSRRRLKAVPIRRSRRTRTSCRPRALRSLRRASTWSRRWRRWAARARHPGSARRRRRARPAR